MASNGSTASVDAIKSDMDALRGDLSALMKDVATLRETATADARAQLGEKASELSGKMAAARDDASAIAGAQVDSARETVRENPLMAVAIAFGLGALLARVAR